MAATLWKQADERSKISMLGFIRRIEKNLGEQNIPFPIKCFCISYYFGIDYFTTHGHNIKINRYENIAEGTTKLNKRNAVYGNEILELLKRKNLHNRYKWTFKVSQTDPDSPGFWIGINNSNKSILSQRDLHNDDANKNFRSYALTNQGRIIGSDNCIGDNLKWDRKWGTEATIEMELAFKYTKLGASSYGLLRFEWLDRGEFLERNPWQWNLIFTVNGQTGDDLVVIIDPSVYHLAVIMSEKGQSIELIKFELNSSQELKLDPLVLQCYDPE